jgi:hypothetical protein
LNKKFFYRHRVIKLAELGFRSFPGDSEVRLGTSVGFESGTRPSNHQP